MTRVFLVTTKPSGSVSRHGSQFKAIENVATRCLFVVTGLLVLYCDNVAIEVFCVAIKIVTKIGHATIRLVLVEDF